MFSIRIKASNPPKDGTQNAAIKASPPTNCKATYSRCAGRKRSASQPEMYGEIIAVTALVPITALICIPENPSTFSI